MRHAERWHARDRERPSLQLERSDNRRRRGRPNTLPLWRWIRAEVCLNVRLGACALSLSEGRGGGLRSLLLLSTYYYYYPLPKGKRHRFCVRACAQSTATAAPDHKQTPLLIAEQLRVGGPESLRLPAAEGKHHACFGQDVFFQSSHSSCCTAAVTPPCPETQKPFQQSYQ